jgi:NAD(P)-dependent dehydrogenase (short-subunit alcohol dehydrogenase family)
MKGRLENKVAIVTGGGSGIGEAISKKFAREGAAVVVVGLDSDPVREVVDEILAEGGRAIGYLADISLEEAAESCVKAAVKEFGKLDILVNNAGAFPTTSTIDKYPLEAFEYMIKNNIYSNFMMTKAAIPHLQKTRGNIVSAGSEAGHMGEPQNTPYGGTKGFVHAFQKGVAVEQAKFGVRSNIVGPGPIDTAWTHKETGPMDAKMEKLTTQGVPMGRRGTPEEVANVYLFLASDEASFVTGSIYYVDGGVTVSKGPHGDEVPSHLKKEPIGELDLKHSKEGNTKVRKEALASMS